MKEYRKELENDRIVAKHLDTLYQTMLEQNLCCIIEPYSRVQVKKREKFLTNSPRVSETFDIFFMMGLIFLPLRRCFEQVSFVADKISLPELEVEKKLSQMILDQKIQGILDQETRVLIIFDAKDRDTVYDDVIETIGAMSKVVDRLYQVAQRLT